VDSKELKSFCATARLGNAARASYYLQLSQPTVTGHIQRLEKELGVTLFDRINRPMTLTKVGEHLSKLAIPLLEGIDSLKEETSQAETKSPLQIASTTSLAHLFLPKLISKFRSQYPDTRIHIRSEIGSQVFRLVKEGEVDLGITAGPPKNDLSFIELMSSERVLIAPLGHPILESPIGSLEDIAKWPIVLTRKGTFMRDFLDQQFKQQGMKIDGVVELDGIEGVKKYVEIGLGISITGRLGLEPGDNEILGIISLSHLLPNYRAGIVVRLGRTLPINAKRFVALAKGAYTGSDSYQDVLVPVSQRRGISLGFHES